MPYAIIEPLGLNSPPLTYEVKENIQKGDLYEIQIKSKNVYGIATTNCEKPSFTTKLANKSSASYLPHQKILADFIAKYYISSLGISYNEFIPESNMTDSIPYLPTTYALKELSIAQQEALDFILSSTNPLLFGDTGSGKTEIYIHLIAKYLNQGKRAMFVMPEISLTPQMESRLKTVFGDNVAIWHSKISKAKKSKILENIENGSIRVLAGARSVISLPLRDLGLIIIDEEHDDAYKSSSKPYFNLRDICLYLGNKNKEIKVLLGSATPSLSSYYNATKNNSLFRLKGRYFNSSKSIKFVPINENMIDEYILDSIQKVLDAKKQAIIFIPTRAHFKSLICKQCFNAIICQNCSVSMSIHLKEHKLMCHYCGCTQNIPNVCPTCQSTEFFSSRMGTASFCDELKQMLPHASIELFDRDNITTQNKLEKILKDFNDGKIDILVGTQMLSKGHDYHNVALSVILGIDFLLKGSDFRSVEKAVALTHQIAGRSGRKESGEVIIQSAQADFLSNFMNDYKDFLDYELSNRPKLYPPHTKLCVINISNKEDSKALLEMKNIVNLLSLIIQKNSIECEIVGSSKALIEKMYNKYRYMILLRSAKISHLLATLHALSSTYQSSDFYIDMDPISII